MCSTRLLAAPSDERGKSIFGQFTRPLVLKGTLFVLTRAELRALSQLSQVWEASTHPFLARTHGH